MRQGTYSQPDASPYHFTANHLTANYLFLRSLRSLFFALILLIAPTQIAPVYANAGYHTVQRGESLGTIAQRYGVNIYDLANNNGIINLNSIYIGQSLKIPDYGIEEIAIEDTAVEDTAVEDTAVEDTAVEDTATENTSIEYVSDTSLVENIQNQNIQEDGQIESSGGYYTVASGDTLLQIADAHGMTLDDLMRLNGLTNPNYAWVGQSLRVTARVTPIEVEKALEPQLATNIYIVQPEDTLVQIARDHELTVQELLVANGLPNPNAIWAGQRLRLQKPIVKNSLEMQMANAPEDGHRWIEIDLSSQILTAWQGDTPVLSTYVSTGLEETPTVTGEFAVGAKFTSQHMTGPDYDLPGVPWVMYFYSGYAIHGAYWHNNFGTAMSHGCVNMRPHEAQFLFDWASTGTEINVHY